MVNKINNLLVTFIIIFRFAIPANKELFFSHATRSRIVDYILRRQRYQDKDGDTFAFGINRLLRNNVYNSAYPLHEVRNISGCIKCCVNIFVQVIYIKFLKCYYYFMSRNCIVLKLMPFKVGR